LLIVVTCKTGLSQIYKLAVWLSIQNFHSHFTKVARKCECFGRIVEPCILKRRVWRYQRGHQNPYIEEEQTTQWPQDLKLLCLSQLCGLKYRLISRNLNWKIWSEREQKFSGYINSPSGYQYRIFTCILQK
jgi:hypothetical protein